MLINDEIIHDFIHCRYKGFLKSKNQHGRISDYEILYNQLKQTQKLNFEKSMMERGKTTIRNSSFSKTALMEGIFLDFNFANENIDLTLDSIEFISKINFIPTFVTPFEKVTKQDKLFVVLQSVLIQNEFNLQSECCRLIYGRRLKQTKFKLTSFKKSTKKVIAELNKALSNSNAPIFFKNAHCQTCEFQDTCFEKLVERDDLSLLTGLKAKEINKKNERGIFSVRQLSYTFRPKKNPYRRRKFLPELKALAIRENKTFIQEIPTLREAEREVFLDIEGVFDRNFYYLIGVIIKTKDSQNQYSFWANNENEEAEIFVKLLDLLLPLKNFVLYHYGSYETQALKSISKVLPVSYQEVINNVLDNSFNILNVFTHNIYPPTYSNSLKEIARFLRFDWSEKDASGLQTMVWRYYWEATQNCILKDKITIYNLEDCEALIRVKEWICSIEKENDDQQFTSSLKSENIYKWGITNYIVKEFEEINSRAYFGYQREHIYLRTEKKVYRAVSKQKRSSKIYNKIDSRISLFPGRCPYCKSQDLTKIRSSKKTQIDLVVMNHGIKRQANEYAGGALKCSRCDKIISTRNIKELSKYGNNLMAWSVTRKYNTS